MNFFKNFNPLELNLDSPNPYPLNNLDCDALSDWPVKKF